MRNSTGGSGLPLRKTCTYDIIYLEGYDHTTYNSVMYLLGLKVGKVLAETIGETELAETTELAFDYGKNKIDRTLWDEKDGFYHSWWDSEKGSPDWLMADSLYGQVSDSSDLIFHPLAFTAATYNMLYECLDRIYEVSTVILS